MDMRKYGSIFLKPDNVRDGPLLDRIVNVFEKYNCPVLELESGDQFSVNNSNTRILGKAYGWDSDSWIGQTIELSLGYYTDKRGEQPEEKETVVIRPISVRQQSLDNGGIKKVQPTLRALTDETPF